ncbi:unnamed protein product [Diabrotica balteata]|uniref:Uncharacterized protein n=1 Tax=Diabrotica balteata TaxID=107213 RepID=A0A9N9T386_DIABA|nr:unnamed protein product [Diabrotica balteata]
MSSEKPEQKCVFCNSVRNEKLLLFSEETISKCKKVLRLRKFHKLKYNDIILPDEIYDSAYHSSCYKTFTALKRQYLTTDVEKKTSSQSRKSLPAVEQPSTSAESSIIVDTLVHDSLEKDGNLPETKEAEKEIDAELPLEEGPSENLAQSSTVETSDTVASASSNSNLCFFFVTKKKKQFRGKIDPLQASEKDQFEKSVLLNFKADTEIYNETLTKIQSVLSRQVYYHDSCRQNFRNQKRSLVKSPVRTSWHISREVHETVYKEICNLIEENVINRGRCYFLSYLHKEYLEMFKELSESSDSASILSHPIWKKSFARNLMDIIYITHNGNLKTSKHICLDMALKSLTSSRKVIDIINRYGHCISYSAVEELETEATFSSVSRTEICPEVINKEENLVAGVAFDNYDRFVDTKTGKDTLHDTVGIMYQNIDPKDPNIEEEEEAEKEDTEVSKRDRPRRRSFESIDFELPQCAKKLRKVSNIQAESEEEVNIILHKSLYDKIDRVWMLSHALGLLNTPMWTGFNNKIVIDNTPQQLITYLTPINHSPTSNAVVLATMQQCMAALQELNQKYMQVTYDLAIAKIALQIQATESNTFQKLFIHLGAFHVMMSYFKAIGKVINDCGLSTIMVESEMIANGSVSSFIEGKHFNRCKRLHPMMALGLQIMHFRSFLTHKNIQISEDITEEIARLQNCQTFSFFIHNDSLKELFEEYAIYEQQTLNGEHGKTAQFYMIYIKLVDHYLQLSRSIRVGDFQLYLDTLPKITNLFFVLNHQNYAKWAVQYHYNLVKVPTTHPGLEQDFQNGFFGIKRTDKPFSRQPIDLTLEQTINADAARTLTGISHLTHSISARQRWARSHDIRSSIITHVLDELGITKKQDISPELQPHNIKNSCQQLEKFINAFDQYVNPFGLDLSPDQLFNIGSGKAASSQVEEFLLNIQKNGGELRTNFISECASDSKRFEKAIKKTPIHNFSSLLLKKKSVKIGGKQQEIKLQRDLFGRLLGISKDHQIDVLKILAYPISPVPLALCHLDGGFCKTDKSVLLKCLEPNVDQEPPRNTDVFLIDGFFILHSMKEVPKTFGVFQRNFLQMVSKYSTRRIDVIFDQYIFPSIKDSERCLRHEASLIDYTISGPEQVRPSDFSKELKNTKFKEALVDFFTKHWSSEEMKSFLGNRQIFINFRTCQSYQIVDDKIQSSVVESLCCTSHEEADTKIVYHACNITEQSNIVIRASDTDILIIMIGNMTRLQNANSNVWMLNGTGNKERYIHITKIYKELGELLAKSLIGFHAFTGCDFNPAFFNKGKRRPFTLLKKNTEVQEAFATLGEENLTEDQLQQVFNSIQKFTCQLYNAKKSVDVDDGRYQLFVNNYKASDVNENFSKKISNFDASSIPPCKSELYQQLLRAHYISTIWKNAYKKEPTTLDPLEFGWIEQDEKFTFKWFEGDQLPTSVSDLITQVPDSESQDDEEESHLETNNSDEDE